MVLGSASHRGVVFLESRIIEVVQISLLAALKETCLSRSLLFIESKDIFCKKATRARPRANPCNNSGDRGSIVFLVNVTDMP